MDANRTKLTRRRPTLLLAPVLRLILRIPGAPRLAHAVARNAAGRHHVGAVAVVVRLDDDRQPMVLLGRHTFHGDRWSVPGGWVRRGEDPAAACEREVGEETGVAVRAVEVLGCDLHAVDGVPVPYGGLTIAYRCELVSPGGGDFGRQSVELAEVGWFPTAIALTMVTGFERSILLKAVLAVSDRTAPPDLH